MKSQITHVALFLRPHDTGMCGWWSSLVFTKYVLIFFLNLSLKGAWSGPWVSTEVVAALIGILVYYLAFTAKNTIQA